MAEDRRTRLEDLGRYGNHTSVPSQLQISNSVSPF